VRLAPGALARDQACTGKRGQVLRDGLARYRQISCELGRRRRAARRDGLEELPPVGVAESREDVRRG
jgi:hypothetical protein